MTLTIREQEVAHWTAEGKTCKEIGMILGISYKTVQTYRARLYRRLNVHSAAQMVQRLIRGRG